MMPAARTRDDLDAPPGVVDPTDLGGPDRSDRTALAAFGLLLVVALVVLFHAGRNQWFFLDEFSVLAGRDLDDPGDLFRAHNEHWVTPTIVAYQVLYRLVGLREYWPYLALSIGAHVAVASGLRAVLRNAGVSAWVATAALVPFVFFGTGYENILWGFQVSWGTSLAFGILYVIAMDHDGPFGRRDLLGWSCGLIAMMSSGVGLFLVAAAASTALFRRGTRPALIHAGSLGLLYASWYVITDPRSKAPAGDGDVSTLAVRIVTNAVSGYSGSRVVGVVLVVAAVAGLVGILRREGRGRSVPARLIAPASLAVAAVAFAAVTAYGRASFSSRPTTRYLYVGAALLLPLLTVGVDAFARRWPKGPPVLAVALLLGLPSNLARLYDMDPYNMGNRAGTLAMAVIAHDEHVDRELRPNAVWMPDLTAGWLADGISSGRIPRPEQIDPARRRNASVPLALEVIPKDRAGSCRRVTAAAPIALDADEMIQFEGPIVFVVEIVGDDRTVPLTIYGLSEHGRDASSVYLRAVRDIVLDQHPATPWGEVSRCR